MSPRVYSSADMDGSYAAALLASNCSIDSDGTGTVRPDLRALSQAKTQGGEGQA
jgi:hypothetical protein